MRLDPPLLPYERDLIQILGCTEEEYKTLLRFSSLKPRVRAAEYDHIPEVEAGFVVPILINLVIGIALTAVGTLLAPKPDIPEQKKIRQGRLPNDVGPSRFNQTSSFDGYSSLVEYGTPVPIPFGKMGEGEDGKRSGGLVLAGSLVWSRAYSVGNHQRVKLLYTLGEYIRQLPSLRGIWIGTTALSSFGGHDFALYWKSQQGENRIKGGNLVAGTRATPQAGDPETQDEVFIAPVDGTIEGPGFCMAYNPNTKRTFGQFNPVRNGTAHRLNWEVISVPFSLQEEPEDMREQRALRIKIAGEMAGRPGIDKASQGGQPGVGRAYSTQVGLVAHNGAVSENKVPYLDAAPGDTVTFRISGHKFRSLDTDEYFWPAFMQGFPRKWGVTHKDVRSAINKHRERADDLMVVGSKWMIGSTQWVVESRSADVWKPNRAVDVVLRCVSTSGSNRIGLAGRRAVEEPLAGYEGPWDKQMGGPLPAHMSDDGFNTNKHCGAAFWNLVQYEVATVRMVRECDTIEFGIRSTVWNRANGLCNFNAILNPSRMRNKDKNDVQLNTPSMSRYFARTSCFSVWVRPLPEYTENGDSNPEWSRINQVFCVTGTSPTPKYNYLRIRPRTQGRYEFRFIPRVGSDIATNSWEGAIFWRLNAQSGTVHGQDFDTAYGAFRVTMTGDLVTREYVMINDELLTDPTTTVNVPISGNIPTAITNYAWSTNTGSTDFYKNAYLTALLGNPSYSGETRSANFTHHKVRGPGDADDGWIEVKVTATANNVTGPRHQQLYGTTLNWAGDGSGINFTVVASSNTRGQWAINDEFTNVQTIGGGNRYSNLGYSTVSAAFRVTAVGTSSVLDVDVNLDDGERIFEHASQVSDCSHYDELSKSCDDNPEHEIVYVNEAVSEGVNGPPQYEDLSMLGLSVKSSQSLSSVEQLRVWTPTGIHVERLEAGAFGPSNLFSDLLYYLLTDKTQGLGEVIPPELVDRDSFATTGRYLLQNRIFWNGVVETEQNLRSFATDNAQKSLCIFTIKNGVFGIQPALPVDSAQAISTSPIAVTQIFSAGNIIENSLQVSYFDNEQRRETALAVRWRVMRPYELPDETTAIVSFADGNPRSTDDLDLTGFCDNEHQALLTARYMLAQRRYVDHGVTFKTTPEAIGIEPGSYIRVVSSEVEFQTGRTIRIADDLHVVAPEPLADGHYQTYTYRPGAADVEEVEIDVVNGHVTDEELRGAISALIQVVPHNNVYQVHEVTLEEDGLVSVSAVIVPTGDQGVSRLAALVSNPSYFKVTY